MGRIMMQNSLNQLAAGRAGLRLWCGPLRSAARVEETVFGSATPISSIGCGSGATCGAAAGGGGPAGSGLASESCRSGAGEGGSGSAEGEWPGTGVSGPIGFVSETVQVGLVGSG